jgi:vacuolar-type H+-ATPase subunit C/Vma6
LPDAKYAFISAYLKGAEAKTVTSDQISRLPKTASPQDVLEIIRGADIGRFLEEVPVKTFDDWDKYLWQYFGQRLEELEWLKLMPADMRKILNTYRVKYDVINIKAVLLGISTGKKAGVIPAGAIYSRGLLDELSGAAKVSDVIQVLIECNLGAYASILGEYVAEEAKSRFLTEAKLDREYYQSLLNVPKGIRDGPLLAKAFSIIMDMTNLQLVTRAIIEGIGPEAGELVISGGYIIPEAVARDLLSHKLTDIPGKLGGTQYRDIAEEVVASYSRTKSITAVEEVIDKHKFRLLREILSPRVMTPLMMVWYLIVKEVEIKNLRLVLKAAFDNIPVEEIKGYLVFS